MMHLRVATVACRVIEHTCMHVIFREVHLSSVRSYQWDGIYMGEEIYYVRVATAHGAHACVGLPMQIPQTCMPLPR